MRASDTKEDPLEPKSRAERPGNGDIVRATYRRAKVFFANSAAQPEAKRLSLYEQFCANWITFVTAFAALTAAIILHVILPPYISVPPLAILACALLSAVVNGRWGTLAALAYSVMLVAVSVHFHLVPFKMSTLIWNCLMRFLFLEIYVVLFDYLRRRGSTLPEK